MTRLGKHVGKRVCACTACSVSPTAGPAETVVDRPAPRRRAFVIRSPIVVRQGIDARAPARRPTLGGVAQRLPEQARASIGIGRGAERRAPVVVKPDAALAPPRLAAHELPHRQRIEEFVGDDDHRPMRVVEIVEPVEPMHRGDRRILQRVLLRPRSTRLISTNATDAALRNPGATRAARSASFISVPAPGPKLDQRKPLRRAELLPDVDAPQRRSARRRSARFPAP